MLKASIKGLQTCDTPFVLKNEVIKPHQKLYVWRWEGVDLLYGDQVEALLSIGSSFLLGSSFSKEKYLQSFALGDILAPDILEAVQGKGFKWVITYYAIFHVLFFLVGALPAFLCAWHTSLSAVSPAGGNHLASRNGTGDLNI